MVEMDVAQLTRLLRTAGTEYLESIEYITNDGVTEGVTFSSDLKSANIYNVKLTGGNFVAYDRQFPRSLITADLTGLDVSQVTSFKSAFDSCENLTDLNVSNWNTSSSGNFTYMFYGTKKLTVLDLSSFKTAGLSTYMFTYTTKNVYVNLDIWTFGTSRTLGNATQLTFFDKKPIISYDNIRLATYDNIKKYIDNKDVALRNSIASQLQYRVYKNNLNIEDLESDGYISFTDGEISFRGSFFDDYMGEDFYKRITIHSEDDGDEFFFSFDLYSFYYGFKILPVFNSIPENQTYRITITIANDDNQVITKNKTYNTNEAPIPFHNYQEDYYYYSELTEIKISGLKNIKGNVVTSNKLNYSYLEMIDFNN